MAENNTKGLKVTMVYEGDPSEIDQAIYGETRSSIALQAELGEVNTSLSDASRERNEAREKVRELEDTCHNLGTDLANERGSHVETQRKLKVESDGHWKTLAQSRQYQSNYSYCDNELQAKRTECMRLEGDLERVRGELRSRNAGLITADDEKRALEKQLSTQRMLNHKLQTALTSRLMVPNDSMSAYEAKKAVDEMLKPGEFDIYPANLLADPKSGKEAIDAKVEEFCGTLGYTVKMHTIKWVRDNFCHDGRHMGLKEAKDLVEWFACPYLAVFPSGSEPIGAYVLKVNLLDTPATVTIGDMIREQLAAEHVPVTHNPIQVTGGA